MPASSIGAPTRQGGPSPPRPLPPLRRAAAAVERRRSLSASPGVPSCPLPQLRSVRVERTAELAREVGASTTRGAWSGEAPLIREAPGHRWSSRVWAGGLPPDPRRPVRRCSARSTVAIFAPGRGPPRGGLQVDAGGRSASSPRASPRRCQHGIYGSAWYLRAGMVSIWYLQLRPSCAAQLVSACL